MLQSVSCGKLAYVGFKPLGFNASVKSALKQVRIKSYSTDEPSGFKQSNTELSLVYMKRLPPTEHQYIKIYGPDTIKFLNGLCTSKLVPTFIKKNLTTISMAPEGQNDVGKMNNSTVNAEKEAFLKKHTLYDELNSMYGNTLGMHSCFLSSQGRLLTDCIFYTPFVGKDALKGNKVNKVTGHKYSEVTLGLPLLENSFKQELIKVMNGHKILSKVKINDLDDNYFETWELCIKDPLYQLSIDYDNLQNSNEYYLACMAMIHRVFSGKGIDQIYSVYMDRQFEMLNDTYDIQPGMVILKVLVKREQDTKELDIKSGGLSISSGTSPEQNDINYKHIKLLQLNSGIITPTPSTMINNKYLPLDLCYDLIPNSISFDKGCYIGQELTTRMYTTNKIKKRLVPFDIVFSAEDSSRNLFKEFITVQKNDSDSTTMDIFTDTPLVQERQAAYNPFASENNSPIKNTSAKKRIRPVGKIIYVDYNCVGDETHLKAIGLLNMDYIAEQYGLSDDLNKDDESLPDRSFYINYPIKKNGADSGPEGGLDNISKIPLLLKPPYWLSSFVN